MCEKELSGLYKNNKIVVKEYKDCPGHSALGHEILHFIEFKYLGKKPKEANNHNYFPGLFFESSGFDSIEMQIRQEIYDMYFCEK